LDNEQFRELMERIETTLERRISDGQQETGRRFDEVDRRLDDLTIQVRLTNGNVRNHGESLANHQPRLLATERDIREIKRTFAEDHQLKPPAGSTVVTLPPDMQPVTNYTLQRVIALVVVTATITATVTMFVLKAMQQRP